MAMRKCNSKENTLPLEEAHADQQELQKEKQCQSQVPGLMEHTSLEKMLAEQKAKRILFFHYAVGCVGVLVMILYLVVKSHCFVDLPLLLLLALLTAVFLWLQLRENKKICVRLEKMLKERRHS